MTLLAEGDQAPNFTLANQDGDTVSLEHWRGNWVLLWWYPQALTPGCTTCARRLQSELDHFGYLGCRVVGVSYDSPERNREFAERNDLGFELVSASPEVAEEWGAKRPDDDRLAHTPKRLSYLIDPDGQVVKVYRRVRPEIHAREVREDLEKLIANQEA